MSSCSTEDARCRAATACRDGRSSRRVSGFLPCVEKRPCRSVLNDVRARKWPGHAYLRSQRDRERLSRTRTRPGSPGALRGHFVDLRCQALDVQTICRKSPQPARLVWCDSTRESGSAWGFLCGSTSKSVSKVAHRAERSREAPARPDLRRPEVARRCVDLRGCELDGGTGFSRLDPL